MQADIEHLVNNNYKILSVIYSFRTDVDGKMLCQLSQKEIGELAGVSGGCVSNTLAELKEAGLIDSTKTRSYSLTERGCNLVWIMERL